MLRLLTLALSGLLLVAAAREWDDAEPGNAAPSSSEQQEPEPVAEPAVEPLPVQEEPVIIPDRPTKEQVAALSMEERAAQAVVVKRLLLQQNMRLLQDEYRLTPENLRDSAEAARAAGAPLFWEQAMRAMATGALSPRERYDLEKSLETFYVLFKLDPLGVRLFVETSDLSPREITELISWLPMEHLFNLPEEKDLPVEKLALKATALKDVFAAMVARFESVHDQESADAAAEALLPLLAPFDSTQELRLSKPQEQAEAFAAYQELLPPLYNTLREQRNRLHQAGYFGSYRLRAVNYLLQ